MNSKRPLVMTLILLVGGVLSLLAGLAVRRHEAVFLRADFAALIDSRLRTIEAGFEQNIELLEALSSLHVSDGQIDREVFGRIARHAHERHPELAALEWAPRVTPDGRADFEASMSALLADFEIVEAEPRLGIRRAGEREAYYPVVYIEPATGVAHVPGFDLASETEARAAIEKSIDSGKPQASRLIRLRRIADGTPGLLVALAIAGDRSSVVGVVVGFYRAQDVAAIAGLPASGIALRFEDSEALPGRPSFSLGDPIEQPEIAVDRRLSLAGAEWRVVGAASSVYVASRRSWESFFVAALGVLLTIAFAVWCRMLATRSSAVVALVESRTQELTRVNADLEHQRGILQSVLDNLGDGVAVADRDGRLTMFNPMAEEILGIGVVSESSDRWSAIYGLLDAQTREPVPSEDLPLSRAVRGEASRNQQLLVRNPQRPGGTFIEVTATPLVDGTGQSQGGVAIFSDVSERKWAEAVLRDSESRFRTIVESTANVLIILSEKLRIREFNPQAEKIFGMSRGTALGQEFLEVCVTEPRRLHVAEALQGALTGEAMEPLEAPIRNATGEERVLLWSFGRFEAAESHDSVVIVSGADVTERRQAEQARRVSELAGHLQSAREAERSHLAREIHDELGQVLTGLKLEISYIGRRAADEDATRERLRKVEGLIDDSIASVRRIAADLRPQMLDQLGMIEAIRWQIHEFERRTGVPCAVEFPDRRIEWEADKDTAMFRILQEALTNIARHAGAGKAWVKVKLDRDAVLLEIGDDGRGFCRDSVVEGSSFGLLGMEERARICGGSLEFAGGAGSGTVVSVRIPRGGAAAAQSEA